MVLVTSCSCTQSNSTHARRLDLRVANDAENTSRLNQQFGPYWSSCITCSHKFKTESTRRRSRQLCDARTYDIELVCPRRTPQSAQKMPWVRRIAGFAQTQFKSNCSSRTQQVRRSGVLRRKTTWKALTFNRLRLTRTDTVMQVDSS